MADGSRVDLTEHIEDEELLYRRILPAYIDWTKYPPEPRSEAFSDRNFRVSVDRALLCDHDPTHTQEEGENFVCCLVTLDVRKIHEVVKGDSKGGVSVQYEVDVEPQPLSHNQAHAEIFALPYISTRQVFRRLRHALQRLSSWEGGIAP